MGAVLGDAYAKEFTNSFIDAFSSAWKAENEKEQGNFVEIYRFCELFSKSSIAFNQHNAELYVSYALVLGFNYDEPRFVPDALRMMAEGFFDVKPNPLQAIRLGEKEEFKTAPKVLAFIATLYFYHRGEGSEKEQDEKAFQCAKEAAKYGDLTAVAFLSSLYQEGIGCQPDIDTADALLDSHFDIALSQVMNLQVGTDFSSIAFFFYQYAVNALSEEDEENAPYRDILRYLLLAKQCFLLAGLKEEEAILGEVNKQIEEVVKIYLADGFDAEIYYDEHSFYDTFVDCNASIAPIIIEKVEFDEAERVLHITVAPFTQYILVDTSSGSTRVVSRERITFHFNGVINAFYPSGPFVTTGFATPADRLSTWQLLDGLEPIVDIDFDPVYLREGD